jgi:hypothetical protein
MYALYLHCTDKNRSFLKKLLMREPWDILSLTKAFSKGLRRTVTMFSGSPSVDAAKAKVYECMQRAGLEPASVDLVLLIGGTSRTPLVQQKIHEIFTAKVVAVDNADSVIAKGAAVISAHKWRPYLVKPVTVKLADKSFLRLFDHGQTLATPVAARRFTFYCVDGRNGIAHLLFHEQQRPHDAAIQKSLNCNLSVPTAQIVRSVADLDRIEVECFVTEDLTIKIMARSSSVGKQQSVEIQDLCYGLETN